MIDFNRINVKIFKKQNIFGAEKCVKTKKNVAKPKKSM